jgi:hypothetical protein
MRAKGEIRTCETCGKQIRERLDGSGLRSHKCQHGHECIAPVNVHPRDGRTHNVPCLECARERHAQPGDFAALVMDLAFAIEDPCGVEAIELARRLVEFGRAIPEHHRNYFAKLLAHFTGLMHELEERNG